MRHFSHIPVWTSFARGSPVLRRDICGADAALRDAIKQKLPCVLPKTATNILHVISRQSCHSYAAL